MVLKCKNTVILTKALHSPLKSSNLFFLFFGFFEGGGGLFTRKYILVIEKI